MIALENLTKRFGRLVAVNGLDLHVRAGEFFVFLGPNGAGKTTTIKMIAGLLRPTEGRVLLDGSDVQEDYIRAKSLLSYVPDQPFIYYWQRERYGDATNQPSEDWRLNGNITFMPNAKSTLNFTASYRDAQNDDLDYTKWNKDNIGAGVNFWIAAAPKVSVMVGLDGVRQSTDAEVIVPVMDG